MAHPENRSPDFIRRMMGGESWHSCHPDPMSNYEVEFRVGQLLDFSGEFRHRRIEIGAETVRAISVQTVAGGAVLLVFVLASL
jgi:hypothetical protein